MHYREGGMGRATEHSAGSHEHYPSKYSKLSSSISADDPLFVDTDLCLSLVRETRPSYSVKTLGKRPFSPAHLMSLVDADLYNPSRVPNGVDSPNIDYSSYSRRPVSLYESRTTATMIRSGASPTVGPVSGRGRPLTPQFSGRPLFETPLHFDTDALFSEFERKFPGGRETYMPSTVSSSRRVVEFTSSTTVRSATPLGFFARTKPLPPPDASPLHSPAIRVNQSGRTSPFVSPRARGYAPEPTDQPIRNPVRHGIEGEVDSLTITMVNNMMTGRGAAGEHQCAKCGDPITASRGGCSALNQTFHLDCFACAVCGVKLSGGAFFAVEGRPHCEKDYLETLEKCTVCSKPIMERILRATGKPFHPACFVCNACRKCLDGVPFTMDPKNVIHCTACFHEKYAPRCAVCAQPIVPEEGKEESLRVVAMDKSFHLECYKCEDCGLKLSSKIEGHECYPLDDHLLCKNCNISRQRSQNAAK